MAYIETIEVRWGTCAPPPKTYTDLVNGDYTFEVRAYGWLRSRNADFAVSGRRVTQGDAGTEWAPPIHWSEVMDAG